MTKGNGGLLEMSLSIKLKLKNENLKPSTSTQRSLRKKYNTNFERWFMKLRQKIKIHFSLSMNTKNKVRLSYHPLVQYYESPEYVLKQIEKCITDSKNGLKGVKSNPLYESFMKMNIIGDANQDIDGEGDQLIKAVGKGKSAGKLSQDNVVKHKNKNKNKNKRGW